MSEKSFLPSVQLAGIIFQTRPKAVEVFLNNSLSHFTA